jgi:hypothetical protein
MYGRFDAGPVSVRRDANAPADCSIEKDLQTPAFSEAAEGIRTLDLLHGKQTGGRIGTPGGARKAARDGKPLGRVAVGLAAFGTTIGTTGVP